MERDRLCISKVAVEILISCFDFSVLSRSLCNLFHPLCAMTLTGELLAGHTQKWLFSAQPPWFISQDDSWFVHTQVGMGVCQELQKQKHTSHCYYLLLDNFNISIASEASREALKIASRTLILRHSNSMFHDISICRKKMPLLQVSVYSNINNLISPDV